MMLKLSVTYGKRWTALFGNLRGLLTHLYYSYRIFLQENIPSSKFNLSYSTCYKWDSSVGVGALTRTLKTTLHTTALHTHCLLAYVCTLHKDLPKFVL